MHYKYSLLTYLLTSAVTAETVQKVA